MMKTYGIGVIGAGNVSAQYLRLVPLFDGLELRAIADLFPETAEARAAEFGVEVRSVEALMDADDVDVVVNLTVPSAHFEVSSAVLAAGKHVYSEKPLALSLDEGMRLGQAAEAAGKTVGCAPDTFLGGAHQFARHLIDEGRVGRITAGTCYVMSAGHEHWHPNPDFFFEAGGGPILDMGPYYIASLVNLLGPARRVAALGGKGRDRRVIGSGPRAGEEFPVEVATTVFALIEFASGAIVTLGASWDVFAHAHHNIELYGTEGALFVPDPNFFAGEVELAGRDGGRRTQDQWEHPLAVPNQRASNGRVLANYRAAGLADMVRALEAGRAPRCSFELALHTLDVMTGILQSAESGEFVDLTTSCAQPAALAPEEAGTLLNQEAARAASEAAGAGTP